VAVSRWGFREPDGWKKCNYAEHGCYRELVQISLLSRRAGTSRLLCGPHHQESFMTGRPFRCRSPSSTGHRPQRHPTCAWLQLAKQFEPLTRNFQTRISDTPVTLAVGLDMDADSPVATGSLTTPTMGILSVAVANRLATREPTVKIRSGRVPTIWAANSA